MSDAFDTLVTSIAASGLPRALEPAAVRVDEPTFDRLLQRAVSERITGHLEGALRTGRVIASNDQYARALAQHEEVLGVDLVLEQLLARTSARFSRAGIPHRALKGPVLARRAYPDPSLRSFGDIDILVPGERFDEAIALLAADGGAARYREPRRNFTARFGKGVCVLTETGLELDIHRVFVAGPFGLAIDPTDLFVETDTIDVGGVSVPAPGARVRFLHACYHAALTSPRLSATRDVAQIACTTDLDVHGVLALATRWRGRAVVQRAVAITVTRFGVELPAPLLAWARRYRPDRFEMSALRAYAPGARSYAAQMATGIWAIRGVRARAAYGVALLVPDRRYIRERDRSYVKRWMRAVRLARQQGRP